MNLIEFGIFITDVQEGQEVSDEQLSALIERLDTDFDQHVSKDELYKAFR